MTTTVRGRARTGDFYPDSGRRPIQHGTIGGNRAHYRYGEPMCEACRQAERERRGYKAPRCIAQCGTVGGYRRHRRLGEPACDPCLQAAAEHRRRYRQPRGAA